MPTTTNFSVTTPRPIDGILDDVAHDLAQSVGRATVGEVPTAAAQVAPGLLLEVDNAAVDSDATVTFDATRSDAVEAGVVVFTSDQDGEIGVVSVSTDGVAELATDALTENTHEVTATLYPEDGTLVATSNVVEVVVSAP